MSDIIAELDDKASGVAKIVYETLIGGGLTSTQMNYVAAKIPLELIKLMNPEMAALADSEEANKMLDMGRMMVIMEESIKDS